MPKLVCKCNNIINLNDIPSPNQLLIIEDVEYDKYSGTIDSEELFREMTLVVRCNKCKRLYIFEDGFNAEPIIYNLEKGAWNNIMTEI